MYAAASRLSHHSLEYDIVINTNTLGMDKAVMAIATVAAK